MDSQVEEQRTGGGGGGGGGVSAMERHLVRLLRGPDSLTFTGPLPPDPPGFIPGQQFR